LKYTIDKNYCLRKVAESENLAFFIADSELSEKYEEIDGNIDKLLLLRVSITNEHNSCKIEQLWIKK